MTVEAFKVQVARAGWATITPGIWERTTYRHTLEVVCSPAGFDWTVRGRYTKSLLASGNERTSGKAKWCAMNAARALPGAIQPSW